MRIRSMIKSVSRFVRLDRQSRNAVIFHKILANFHTKYLYGKICTPNTSKHFEKKLLYLELMA